MLQLSFFWHVLDSYNGFFSVPNEFSWFCIFVIPIKTFKMVASSQFMSKYSIFNHSGIVYYILWQFKSFLKDFCYFSTPYIATHYQQTILIVTPPLFKIHTFANLPFRAWRHFNDYWWRPIIISPNIDKELNSNFNALKLI